MRSKFAVRDGVLVLVLAIAFVSVARQCAAPRYTGPPLVVDETTGCKRAAMEMLAFEHGEPLAESSSRAMDEAILRSCRTAK